MRVLEENGTASFEIKFLWKKNVTKFIKSINLTDIEVHKCIFSDVF